MAESEEEKRIRDLEINAAKEEARLNALREFVLRQHGLWIWLLTGLGAVVLAGVAGVILVKGPA